MWLENKYIGLLSTRLDRFKRKNNGFNFRCPYCGDSSVSNTKARGWIYQEKGRYRYHCFNCDHHTSFDKFLKDVDTNLYYQFKLDILKESKTAEQIDYEQFIEKLKPKKFISETPLKTLKKVSQLSPEHPIKKYVQLRKIPNVYHSKLFSCPNFMSWSNTIVPDKFSENALKHDETRLLIPFINKDQKLHAFQGRSLNPNSKTKYITIIIDEDVPKVYGLDTTDLNKRTYVFEGPIDAMFIPNAIASAGGDIIATLKPFKRENLVIVYDNEPRSKETKSKLDKAIMNGYNVVIWPDNLEYKDINDMILNGLSSEFIKHIIDSNIYSDLPAKLKLTKWSKV